MDLRRDDLDSLAFALALGSLAASGAAFAVSRNGAACVMSALCLAGLIAARFAGFSGLTLLGIAVGLALILYVVWIDPPASSRRTSALAHTAGGVLIGYGLAITLRRRLPGFAWAALTLIGVAALTIVWEVGELVGDRALDTALVPNRRDSAEDIFFGSFGGLLAVAFAGLVSSVVARSR